MDEKPRGDVYVKLLHLAPIHPIRTETVADGVYLDYRTDPKTGEQQLVGIEILSARSIKVDAKPVWPLADAEPPGDAQQVQVDLR